MPTPMVCRMCLAIDTRMYMIANTPLQRIYEKMTDIMLLTDDERPMMACYICYHLLKRSEIFIQKCQAADELLKGILSKGLEITEKSVSLLDQTNLSNWLNTSSTDYMYVGVVYKHMEIQVKVEDVHVKKEEVIEKSEEIDIEYNVIEDPGFQDHRSSSDDEIPLQALSTKKKVKIKEKKQKLKRKRQNYEESMKLMENVTEIILTKEEQMAEVLERAKSLNYLNSPYKCSLCYKGFIDAKAYENHKQKHDECSGPFACEMCRLRYRTKRLLRTHSLTSHARKYACGQCSHRSHTANQAREHERWHNGHTYECQLCSQTFRKPTSYLTHMRKRHPTSHVCSACGLSFVGAHGLLMHRTKAHTNSTEKIEKELDTTLCTECNIHFSSMEAWQRHVLTAAEHYVDNGTSVSCLTCKSKVRAGPLLRAHVREHVRERARERPDPAPPRVQLPCEQCGSSFSSRSKLQAHVRRTHLGLKYNKNVVCEVCGKHCTSNASLKYHQRTHTGERPYPCGQCNKRFADKNQLRIHGRTHSGERPYGCALCSKRFSQKPALNRHYRIHTGAKPYSCTLCTKSFSQSNSLKLHVRSVHLKLAQNKKKAVDPPTCEK